MRSLRAGRTERFEAMITRLRTLGFSVDFDAIRRVFPRANLGRRHLADYLVRTRQIVSSRDVFNNYLGDGGPACVERPRLASGEAIALINEAGGVAALAHPPQDLRESQLRSLVDEGLRAIETNGPGFSTSKSRRINLQAERLGLIGIAGSDFHSADRPGRWVGAITTPRVNLERLRAAVGRQPETASVPATNSTTGESTGSVE